MNNKPTDKVNPLTQSEKEKIKQSSKVFKYLVSKSVKYTSITIAFLELLSQWKDPFEVKKIMAQRTTGMRINTILWNSLYFPDIMAENERLTFQTASAGRWNAYDFLRTDVLSSSSTSSHHFHDVQLLFFPLEQLKNNDIETETPEGLFDIFNVEHMVEFTKFSVISALDFWAIEETTYQKAYEKIWDIKLLKDIEVLSIGDKKVYQVTPKGSTLIFPFKWWWDRTPPKTSQERGKHRSDIFQLT